MNISYIKEIRTNFWWFSPAVVMFFLALLPTLKYGYPLSWDIYYHTHMAHLYLEHGFTYFDPLTYAPFGRPIFYPPLFQYLLAAVGVLFYQDILTFYRVLLMPTPTLVSGEMEKVVLPMMAMKCLTQ